MFKVVRMGKQAKRKANLWISIAAEEFRKVQKRWKIPSIRQFSKFLKMSPRTLSKFVHVDGSLTLESIAKIYKRLVVLKCLKFVDEELVAEEQRLKDSMFRVMMSVSTIPQSIAEVVQDELEHQM